MKKITVLLCDDHSVVRESLRFLLEAAGDIQVVGEAENGHQAVPETKRLLPDVVVPDLAMPLLNGVGVAREITRKVPSTKVLILSAYSDEQHVRNAIEAGAAGYLMKKRPRMSVNKHERERTIMKKTSVNRSNSRDQKNRAADLARKVEGVREVENNITVKESAK